MPGLSGNIWQNSGKIWPKLSCARGFSSIFSPPSSTPNVKRLEYFEIHPYDEYHWRFSFTCEWIIKLAVCQKKNDFDWASPLNPFSGQSHLYGRLQITICLHPLPRAQLVAACPGSPMVGGEACQAARLPAASPNARGARPLWRECSCGHPTPDRAGARFVTGSPPPPYPPGSGEGPHPVPSWGGSGRDPPGTKKNFPRCKRWGTCVFVIYFCQFFFLKKIT